MTGSSARLVDVGSAWYVENQRHLVVAAEAVRARFDGELEHASDATHAAAAQAREVFATTGRPVALDRVSSVLGLTGFERDVMIAVAAPEIGLPHAGRVDFGRALSSLADPHWSALLPDAPLRGWRVVDFAGGAPAEAGLVRLPLGVDERVVHALIGIDTVDARLAGRARLGDPVCSLPPAHLDLARALAGSTGAAQLVGDDRLTRRQVGIDAASYLALQLLVVDGDLLPEDPGSADLLARLLAREAGLGQRLVLVESERAAGHRSSRLATAVAGFGAPCIVSSDEPVHGAGERAFRLPPTAVPARRALFAQALDRYGVVADPDDLAHAHPLTPAAIALAVSRAGHPGAAGPADVDHACRESNSRPVGGLAEVRRPVATLADLVLAQPVDRALHAMLAHVRQRRRVHGEWGYAARGRGLAVTALFAGPSGTGKTTAAEAVAAELGLDLVAVDLSQVVSKYIGETEKHLGELFDAGQSGAVLLFDEGDALFGRRTQVRDAHDRYANLETAYLLQRLDTYTGIAILTTNNRDGIDPAFTRRMRFVVTFGFPDAAARAQLWRNAFPAGVPTDGLEVDRLAQLAVSGGTIAQLALHAAFLAADAGEPVRMSHALQAARIECDKLDRPLAPAEIRGWT